MNSLIDWIKSNFISIFTIIIIPIIYNSYIANLIHDFEYYFMSFHQRFMIAISYFFIFVMALGSLTILVFINVKETNVFIIGIILIVAFLISTLIVLFKKDPPVIDINGDTYILCHKSIGNNYLVKKMGADQYMYVTPDKIINKAFTFQKKRKKHYFCKLIRWNKHAPSNFELQQEIKKIADNVSYLKDKEELKQNEKLPTGELVCFWTLVFFFLACLYVVLMHSKQMGVVKLCTTVMPVLSFLLE